MADLVVPPSESPVLCLDTCIVLDILREPTRWRDFGVFEQEASLSMLHIAEAGSGLEVRVAAQVCREYSKQVAKEQEKAAKALAKFKCDVGKVDDLNALHGSEGRVIMEHWDGLPERCMQAADRWMQVAKQESLTDVLITRAFARLNKPRRPARRGRGEMKDCVILETYLAYVRRVRENSDRIVVFVSSNKTDFANEYENDIADELLNEFDTLDLKYAPNMRMARRLLGLLRSPD